MTDHFLKLSFISYSSEDLWMKDNLIAFENKLEYFLVNIVNNETNTTHKLGIQS